MHKLIIAIAAIILLSCHHDRKDEYTGKSILPADTELKAGDIVFRCGTGMLSQVVLNADDGTYSHVGIVVDSAGRKMVVHAVPDEPDFPGDPDRVKMEGIDRFYDTGRASTGAVKRHQDEAAASKAAHAAKEMYRRNILFDHDFDDSDSTELYCSELVERAYMKAGHDIAEGRRHQYQMPAITRNPIIMPSDIYESSQLKLIRVF